MDIQRWFVTGASVERFLPPLVDLQMHTHWTDGSSTVQEMIDAAREKRLCAIAITEHVNETTGWFSRFATEVSSARSGIQCPAVYIGAEIAAADYRGRLKAESNFREAEVVLGVVHRYPKESGDGFWAFNEITRDDAIELEIRALRGLTANPSIDVIGHPGGTAYKKFGVFPVEWLEEVFCYARDNGIAVELNTKYLWDIPGILALLRKVNPMVSFGSDAHCAADVAMGYSELTAASAQYAMRVEQL